MLVDLLTDEGPRAESYMDAPMEYEKPRLLSAEEAKHVTSEGLKVAFADCGQNPDMSEKAPDCVRNDSSMSENVVSADTAGANDGNAAQDTRECQPIRDLMEECAELERIVDRLTAKNADAVRAIDDLGVKLHNMTCARDRWMAKYESIASHAPTLASDGEPIEVGQTLYGLSDGKAWTVDRIDRGRHHSVMAHSGKARRALEPVWLTHVQPWSLELALERFGAMFEHETDDVAPLVANAAAEIREKLAKEGARSGPAADDAKMS